MMDRRLQQLERDLRLIKRYVAGATLLLGVLSVAAFRQSGRTRYTEIDVERLNVVEKNGTLRLAIFNSERKPPIIFRGKEYPGLRGGQAIGMAGMNNFNEEGSEVGGFGWRGRGTANGGHTAAGHLIFDQYDQDETLILSYTDLNGQRRAGLSVVDQPNVSIQPGLDSLLVIRALPDGPEKTRRMEALRELRRRGGEIRATRFFAGKDASKSAVVSLADPRGRPRLRLSVDSLGTARLEFLDDSGRVTHAVPGAP
jgi:hypothetical protein